MSILLTAKQLHKSYGARVLFDSIDLVISAGEKIGLIGPNGAGKSTLLRILNQENLHDAGEVIPTRGLRINYLDQSPRFQEKQTIAEALTQRLGHLESWEIPQKLHGLSLDLDLNLGAIDLEKPVAELSGGWKKKIAILRELAAEPDLMLMDEPTNHLDVDSIFWLEQIVQNSKAAFITITHDRYFLDKVSSKIFELDKRNEKGLLIVDGNYSRYLEVKTAIMEAQENREAILKGVLRRETEWLKAGVKARTTKQQARIQRHAEISAEVSQLSKRNKLEEINMDFQDAEDKPKRLVETKQIAKSYDNGKPLFERLDLLLTPGTRIGLLGENGCGKSSLIRVLLKQEKPDHGKIFHSDLLKTAYFEQGRETLDPNLTLIESVCPHGDKVYYQRRMLHVRSYLEKFLFEQDKMEMVVGQLSGGEQSRILLARLMLIEANLLILDEPTNDLDIATLNVLEECLLEFEGAIIVVSHDRFFLDRVSTKLLAFPPKRSNLPLRELREFASFDQWQQWYQAFERSPSPALEKKSSSAQKSKVKSTHKQQQAVMKEIEKRENKLKALEQECAQPEIASDFEALEKKGAQISKLQYEIAELYESWAELDES